jgi:Fe-S-cluster-containing dehydrogenase component
MVIDLKRCSGCKTCSVVCKVANNIPNDIIWNRVLTEGCDRFDSAEGTYPNLSRTYLPLACQHCENPQCVSVCPTEASHKLPDGTIQIDKSKCIGCQFCVMSCPYGVRYLNEEEGVVEKCTLCQQRTAQGELPQCVSQCCGMARWYGDAEAGIESFEGPRGEKLGDFVNDFTEDQVYQLTDVGNGPSMFYIMRNIKWQGVE